MKKALMLLVVALLVLWGIPAAAQETIIKGKTSSGVVKPILVDSTGHILSSGEASAPGYVILRDVSGNLVVIEAPTTGMSATTKRLDTSSVMLLFNGITYDPAKNGPVGELTIGVQNWPSAFNEGAGTVSAAKVSSFTLAWPVQTTATIGTAEQTILSSKVVGGYPNWTVQVKNTDGADPFTDLVFYGSPDGTNWIEVTTTNINAKTNCVDGLTAGSTCLFSCFACSIGYLKVGAKATDANAASSSVWLNLNVN